MAKECNIQKNSIGKGIEKQIQPSRISESTSAQSCDNRDSQEVLNTHNSHRAAQVMQIDHPEYGIWNFEWRGQKLREGILYTEYAHIASKPGNGNATIISDSSNEMKQWKVVAWKYDVNLSDLWDNACRAFSGTSFEPERRAAQYIRQYEQVLIDDLQNMPEQEKGQYIIKFKEWVRILFDRHARILSAMITGPANFPTRRNEKANNSYERAVEEFETWRKKAQQAIARRIEAAKSQEQKDEEAWQRIKNDIDNHYLPTNLYKRIETIARKGEVELMERAVAYVRELNQARQHPIFTERHKFFKLPELARIIRKQLESRTGKESRDMTFEGMIIRYNYAEDRLQILFDQKPNAETIDKLKHSGFRWSPNSGAWQRQLTTNARYAVQRIFGISL